MFSQRIEGDLCPNRLARLLAGKRASGAVVLDLTESNPTRAGFAYPGKKILSALSQERALLYEPQAAGLATARQAVADYYAARGQKVQSDQVFLTASTSEAYSHLFKLLADPGDEALVPRPSYPLFEYLARLEAVRAVPYPLVYDDAWQVDAEALAAAVTGRTRAVMVVHPNNPTGNFLKRRELEWLTALCRERGLAIIADEVFSDYALEDDPARVPSLCGGGEALTFSLSGLSKVGGLPQMKLSWIVISGPPALRREATERLELIADTYLSVGTPVQQALPQLLAAGAGVQQEIRQRVRGNLALLESAVVKHSPCRVLRVEGGWYAVLQIPRTRSEEEWALRLLEEDSVLAQPGYFYDFPSEAFFIISLLTPPETFREGVGRLLRRVGEGG